MTNKKRSLAARLIAGVALLLAASVSSASAETLLMPTRDARTTAPVVVWGVHTQAGAPACALDFGDLSAVFNCTGVARSYIAQAHTYASQGTYTATLTVGAESTTTVVRVFNPAAFLDGGAAGDNNRTLGINMAIQDGLRYLWTTQDNLAANFPASVTTSWLSIPPFTALVALAFENHGYRLPNNANPPTGLYEKYIVRRALNSLVASLSQLTLTTQTAGSPCVGAGIEAAPCVGLYQLYSDVGYSAPMVALPFAGSGALSRVITEVSIGGYTKGYSIGEILQRMVNSLSYGQGDVANGSGRGGWNYGFNGGWDGSTVGWNILTILDAQAVGIVVPPWVQTEYAFGQKAAWNTDGSFDYTADSNVGALSYTNQAKAGTAFQGYHFIGNPADGAAVGAGGASSDWATKYAASLAHLSATWDGRTSTWSYGSTCGTNFQNKGCAYAMLNVFKGLKLNGVVTLPGVGRAAGPGLIPANDWYADYQDWLTTNQSAPTTTAGGGWPGMVFSIVDYDIANAAVAELILSGAALVLPDEGLFGSVGLSPATATNPIGASHTVTATAQSTAGSFIPGVTINFKVLTGPNANLTGTGVTNALGQTSLTYTGLHVGTDTIVATIGTTLTSNTVSKIWFLTCDVDRNDTVNNADLLAIRAKNGQSPVGQTLYDPNGDGAINVADVRYCQLRLTPARPAVGP